MITSKKLEIILRKFQENRESEEDRESKMILGMLESSVCSNIGLEEEMDEKDFQESPLHKNILFF